MWLFHFRQDPAGSEHSNQSPESGCSVHSAGQYHYDTIIRNLQKQLLLEKQEKERARHAEERESERARTLSKLLAEKERENVEKENFIAEIQANHIKKVLRLEAVARQSQSSRALKNIKLIATKQKLRRQEAEPKRPAGVFDLAPDNAVPPSISELGLDRSS